MKYLIILLIGLFLVGCTTVYILPSGSIFIVSVPEISFGTLTPTPAEFDPTPTQEFATWTPQPFPTQVIIYETTNTSRFTYNIRELPDTESKIVGKLQSGSTIEYVSLSDGWYKVILPSGSNGYLSATCCN